MVKKNISLCGMPGSGKSTIGKAVSRLIEWDFVDTDHEMATEAGVSVGELFAQRGETEFRRLERNTILRQLSREKTIISLGGGALEFSDNLELIKQHSTLVWLDIPFEILISRLENDTKRPILLHKDGSRRTKAELEIFLHELFERRKNRYLGADIRFVCTGNSAQDAEILLKQL